MLIAIQVLSPLLEPEDDGSPAESDDAATGTGSFFKAVGNPEIS